MPEMSSATQKIYEKTYHYISKLIFSDSSWPLAALTWLWQAAFTPNQMNIEMDSATFEMTLELWRPPILKISPLNLCDQSFPYCAWHPISLSWILKLKCQSQISMTGPWHILEHPRQVLQIICNFILALGTSELLQKYNTVANNLQQSRWNGISTRNWNIFLFILSLFQGVLKLYVLKLLWFKVPTPSIIFNSAVCTLVSNPRNCHLASYSPHLAL